MLVIGKAMVINFSFLLAIVLLVHCQIACLTMALTNIDSDKSALLTLKSHISFDPSQILSKNWSASASVCEWIGVTCSSRNQRVAALDISMMDLTGILVPQLENLTFLVSLNLSNNNFHGIVPQELIRLRRLKVIDLSFNVLSGEISSWFGPLSHDLQILNLRNNSFTGVIPPSLSNTSKLEILDLSFNPLQGEIPQEIGNLHKLKTLLLQYNQLSGLVPRTLFNMSKMENLGLSENSLLGDLPGNICRDLPRLEGLFLSSNELSGEIPANLSECSQLQILSLSYNKFGGSIPREMGKLRMLEILYLGANNLTGAIPEELSNITVLKELDLSENQFAGSIPPNVFNISSLRYMNFERSNVSGMLPGDMCSNLKQLEEVHLQENEIFGPLPKRLYECSALQILTMSLNKLHGSIPPEIGNSTLLKVLYLTGNKLTGEIPREVGNLKNLEEISLSGNSLSGSIPLSLLNISTLRVLGLSENQLTGNLAPNLGYMLPNLEILFFDRNFLTSESPELSFITSLTNCRYLRKLSIGGNGLNGILPASIGNLSTSLQNLYASDCNLRGRIPEEIGNLSNLIALTLRGNQLTGSFPKSLANLHSLQGLYMESNKISGALPSTICKLQNLNGLSLSDNEIYGSIPDCIGNITTLRTLNLDTNKLNSNIPASLWNMRELRELNLYSNFLIGSLPPEMANLKVAAEIDLSMNQFSGIIPSKIGDLQALSILYLEHNKLQGTIPESVANMLNLEILDLSHNDLSGIIPKSLQNLRYLTFFNVSFNGLNGEIPTDGPFKNFTYQSFVFNKGLCGDPRYHVPPCLNSAVERRKRKSKIRVLFISLGTSSVVLGVILIFGIARYQRKKKASTPGMIHFWSGKTPLRFSYYELLEATQWYNESNLLGSGSFGNVYKGTLRNGKDVAVKVFSLQLEGAFKSFEVECEVLRNLLHRNLCKVIGSCSNQDFKALVLEYMPCGSLEKWLYSHNYFLEMIQRISIMIDVACALEYLHQGYLMPVIHCDLKPSNILLDEHMTARLCDFGVAKLLGDGESFAQTMTLATLGYIAPEYGLEGLVSVKCDVYSYGIILLEVFTRKKPNDEIFTGNMSLRSWVKDSMPNAVLDIVDSNLLRPHEDWSSQKLDCLSSIMELGLNCSMESPYERISMKDVILALNKTKLRLLAI